MDAQRGKRIDSHVEPWALERVIRVGDSPESPGTAGSTVTIRMLDEGSLFNLSAIVDNEKKAVPAQTDRLARLLEQIPADGAAAAELAAALTDWLDKAPEGTVESGPYERRERAETFPLFTLNELLIVPGFTRRFVLGYDAPDGRPVPGLAAVATARWGTGRYNVNTVPYEVLIALSAQMNAARAASILAERQRQPFETIQQVKDLFPDWPTFMEDVGGLLTVTSDLFRAEILRPTGGGDSALQHPDGPGPSAEDPDGIQILSLEILD